MNWFHRFFALSGLPSLVIAAGIMFMPLAAPAATNPLSKSEFDAVVEEARRVGQEQRRVRAEDRASPKWQTLDREKLARLLRMPEFAALDGATKEPLIDQAGAWELMPFGSPSEALATWARWFPDGGVDKPIAPDARDVPAFIPHVYYADAKWATEAGAMIALLRCYPNAAWYVRHDEPMLWTMEHNTQWDHANAFDFGMCVRKQREDGGAVWSSLPDTPRGVASAKTLERVLSRYLLDHGCSGSGPDRCLPMLHALLSLSPQHRSLPAILKQIEPEFAPAQEVAPPPAPAHDGPLSDAEREQVRQVARAALRKVFYLSAKLPVLLERPAEWPQGEFERTLGQLLKLSITLKRAERLNQGRTNLVLGGDRSRFFADPWRWLNRPGPADPARDAKLRQWGKAYAGDTGCGFAELGIAGLPRPFWLAYAEHKLEREGTTCGALAQTDAAALYAAAATQGKPALLAPLAGLRKFLDKDSPASRELVATLAASCPPAGKDRLADPWGVCRRAEQAVAEEEARQRASERAAPHAPPACAQGTAAAVAGSLGYLGRPYLDACKPMPSDAARNIVALCYLHPGVEPSDPADGDMGSYDLDVAIVKADNHQVTRRLLLENVYQSDAWRFSGIEIDTARYNLAPGIRAFGIRASHSGSSRADPAGDTALNLFVEDGGVLRQILGGLAVSQSQGEWDTNCAGEFSQTQRSIAVGKTRSNGYADLVVTSVSNQRVTRMVGDECTETATRPELSRFTLRYDGKAYVVPAALQ